MVFWPRLGFCSTKSQLCRKLNSPYLTKRYQNCYLGWVQSFSIENKLWLALFSYIYLSQKANFSLVLLIKVLLIKNGVQIPNHLTPAENGWFCIQWRAWAIPYSLYFLVRSLLLVVWVSFHIFKKMAKTITFLRNFNLTSIITRGKSYYKMGQLLLQNGAA